MFNVLLFTIDSLRPDVLGCYGSNEKITPNIDSFARDGIVFNSAISQGPRTAESFPAILSGKYGSTYLDLYNGLSQKRVLISEILKDNGFHTAAFNSNPYISRYKKYDRGFDHFVDNISEIKNINNHWLRLKLTHLKTLFQEPYTPANIVNEQVKSWLSKELKPYFLWVHYMDVHGPYIPKSGWALKNRIKAGLLWKKSTDAPGRLTEQEKEFLVRSYKEEVEYADNHVRELLDCIDRENTIIILMADHGEFMGEHGLFGHPPFYLYDSLLKIPLIIKLPDSMKVGAGQINRTVKSLDVVPTILDALNITHKYEMHGETLLPLMKGSIDSYRCDYFISEIWANHLSIRTEKWKLIYRIQNSKKTLELFNLENDPGEEINVVRERPDIVSEMEHAIQTHMKKVNAPSKNRDASNLEEENEEVKARLKKLGYM